MNWKTAYGRNQRPDVRALQAYFSDNVFALFSQFSDTLLSQYNVACAPAVYSTRQGWTFRFGRNNLYLVSGISISDGVFHVHDIAVCDEESCQKALAVINQNYIAFKANYDEIVAHKIAQQAERTKLRLAREKQELANLQDRIIPEKFNRYRWSPKVARRDFIRLYEADAKGLPDEDLANEIGTTLYTRCVQGRDTCQDIEAGKLTCHHCGNVLSYENFMQCTCGYQYIFRDYMRSFRKENMPAGAATHIFNAFIVDFEKAKSYHEKMRLIDNLIHEFHINLTSGVKGRFVGINLIEGTKKQIADLILTLAYGHDKDTVIEQFKKNLG